jgi:hypothetical protein
VTLCGFSPRKRCRNSEDLRRARIASNMPSRRRLIQWFAPFGDRRVGSDRSNGLACTQDDMKLTMVNHLAGEVGGIGANRDTPADSSTPIWRWACT